MNFYLKKTWLFSLWFLLLCTVIFLSETKPATILSNRVQKKQVLKSSSYEDLWLEETEFVLNEWEKELHQVNNQQPNKFSQERLELIKAIRQSLKT